MQLWREVGTAGTCRAELHQHIGVLKKIGLQIDFHRFSDYDCVQQNAVSELGFILTDYNVSSNMFSVN